MAAVQLRLGFEEPTGAVTLRLSGIGLRVSVETQAGLVNDAHAYLHAAGLAPEVTSSGLTFPVARFAAIVDLPEQVTLFADDVLKPLLEWVENPCDDDLAAELDVEADGTLWMRWTSAGVPLAEPLSAASSAALLAADIPFIATDAAFEMLRTTCHLPLLVGRCRTDRADYVEIETSKPQLVENSGLVGLFRIDETHYGLPFPRLGSLAGRPGFVWDGPAPRLEPGPRVLPPMPARLSRHVFHDLRPLVDALAAYRTQVVEWESGLGRRVFVLAALETLDAYPALVVCRPDRLWQWWRHATLFSRSVSVDDTDADVRVTTYAEFGQLAGGYFAQALVFDDVTSPQAADPQVAAAAVGVGGLLDCYLVGITDNLPTDPKQLVSVMSRLRPAEFSCSVPLVERYGTSLRERLAQHVDSYVSSRRAADPGKDQGLALFNHTQVVGLEMPRALRKAYDEVAERVSDPVERVRRQQSIVAAGTQFTMSPKIATAMEIVNAAVDAGRRVALVAADQAAAEMLAALLRPHQPVLVSCATGVEAPKVRLVLVTGDGSIPDLSWFDEVVVVSYPVSFADLDAAVGDPRRADGPLRVTCLHVLDSVDDAAALAAARNAEHGTRHSIVDLASR